MSDKKRPSESKEKIAKGSVPRAGAKKFFFDTNKMSAEEIARAILLEIRNARR